MPGLQDVHLDSRVMRYIHSKFFNFNVRNLVLYLFYMYC